MKAVMDHGTGKTAAVEGYNIGAKTGTAEKLPRNNGKYVLSFIGCAPLDNPEVVVYVVIDEPNTAAQDDSSLVLGLAKKIMSQAFPYLNVTTVEGYDPAAVQEQEQFHRIHQIANKQGIMIIQIMMHHIQTPIAIGMGHM